MMQKEVNIRNLSNPEGIALRARYCSTFFSRLRGLSFRRSLGSSEGILLVQERESLIDSSIHMLFMWMDLMVVWIDSSMTVVDVKHARRWRLAYFPRRPARYVLETSTDYLNSYQIGDLLSFEEELLH